MKYEIRRKRRDDAEDIIKLVVDKAKNRSVEVVGESDYAFVTGYLASVLAFVASESPASMKKLKEMV